MDIKPLATMPRPAMWQRADDRDRIAQGINDIVVRRIFAAGLDLQGALALIGDHPGAAKVSRAIDELDQAIRDVRDVIFELRAPGLGRLS
jgi:signal transduction histidine kinase